MITGGKRMKSLLLSGKVKPNMGGKFWTYTTNRSMTTYPPR